MLMNLLVLSLSSLSLLLGVLGVLSVSPLRWILADFASREPFSGLLGGGVMLLVLSPLLFVIALRPFFSPEALDLLIYACVGVSVALWSLFTALDALWLAWVTICQQATEEKPDVE